MAYILVGLGNPGIEYKDTRHNVGRMVLEAFARAHGAEEFSSDKKLKALTSSAKLKKESLVLVMPETFMNNSGKSIGPLVTAAGKASPKKAEKMIVVYDDFHLPIGSLKISFNRSSGGHNGLESIIKFAKTEAFVRVRVGVSPTTPGGKIKVPHGDKEVEKFILGPFKPAEAAELKKVTKRAVEAIETVILEGREKAMSVYNAG
jgi:PTH1 family peptidyl-tRNA hydrolase